MIGDGPDWLQLAPAAYLQQIVIRGGIDPWNPNNLSAEQVTWVMSGREGTLNTVVKNEVKLTLLRYEGR